MESRVIVRDFSAEPGDYVGPWGLRSGMQMTLDLVQLIASSVELQRQLADGTWGAYDISPATVGAGDSTDVKNPIPGSYRLAVTGGAGVAVIRNGAHGR